MPQHGIVVLAAGNASRMGKPKQLLTYKNKYFVQHIVEEALKVKGSTVMVVLGAFAEKIKPVIEHLPAQVAINATWQTGMASSIQTGLKALLQSHCEIENVIIAVADQPHVSSALFGEMIDKRNNDNHSIVACSYQSAIGTPVLFDRKYFLDLCNLKGQEGAKKIVLQNKDDVATISFALGHIDIDTEEDYAKLNNSMK